MKRQEGMEVRNSLDFEVSGQLHVMVTLPQWGPCCSLQNRTYKPQSKNKHCKRKSVPTENQMLLLQSSTL